MNIASDGETIRSTAKMDRYDRPLHITSAHFVKLKITRAGLRTDRKRNEIPGVRDLIGLLEVAGCIVVADAMHCQIVPAGS